MHMSIDPKEIARILGTDKLETLTAALPCYLAYSDGLEEARAKARALAAAPDKTRVNMEKEIEKEREEEDTLLPSWIKTLRDTVDNGEVKHDSCSQKLTPKTVRALNTLGAVSLNNIHVVVDGVMSVATNAVPATIQNIEFTGEKTNSSLWNASADSPVTLQGTITGTYLTDSTITITNAQDLGISDVAAISDGSSDQSLHFSLKLSKTIPDQTELTIVPKKKSAPDGTPYVYKVQYLPTTKPAISKISFEKEDTDPTLWTKEGELKGTIRGEHFFGGKATITIENSDGLGISDIALVNANSSDGALQFTMKISKPVPDGTVLKFTVAAPAASDSGSAAKSASNGGSADKSANAGGSTGKSAKAGGSPTKPDNAGGANGKTDSTGGSSGKPETATYSYVVHYAFDIKTVKFDNATKAAWSDTKNPLKGTITGDNLKECTPEIAEAKDLGIAGAKVTKSADNELDFTMQLGKPVANGTKLTFTLSKDAKDADGKDVTLHSGTSVYTVSYTSEPAKPTGGTKPKQPTTGTAKKTTKPSTG